jgi:sigma-B regulation protein RsbU (phosphoserine phosphatase)
VTAFYAVLDPARRTLTYSTAGHNPPRLVRGERVIPLNKNGDLPMGIFEGQQYGQATESLERGDVLLLKASRASGLDRISAALKKQFETC